MLENTNSEEFKPLEPAIRGKEIDLIQSVITRMADNQFKVKQFCIIILCFFIWILPIDFLSPVRIGCFLASSIVMLVCYFLECRYLQAERLYRMWFDFLQRKRSETREWLYLINPTSIKTILNEQTIKWDGFNIEELNKNTWGLKTFYGLMFLIISIFYTSTFLAAFFNLYC